jgi:hypothetical protein
MVFTFDKEYKFITMIPKTAISFKDLQTAEFELEKTTVNMNLSEIFAERKGSYLNEFTLFLAYFNAIPNFINEINIDCTKANKWFMETYKKKLKVLIFIKGNNIKQKHYGI